MRYVLAAVLVAGFAGGVRADGAKKPAADAPKKADKLTGEVVDITCFAQHEAKGDKHASCAAKCLAAGMPAGIVADGKLYVVTMKDHTAPNAKLAAWAGKEVTAMGARIEMSGAHIFEIDTVEPAAAPAKK
jgi:hypothetical protein